jgi:hypothetical protein
VSRAIDSIGSHQLNAYARAQPLFRHETYGRARRLTSRVA